MRTRKPFTTPRRNDSKTFQVTLNFTCGLPRRVCDEWQRRSFHELPDTLANHRNPKDKGAAEAAAYALIDYLKIKQAEGSARRVSMEDITVGEWIEKFTALETSPRTGINAAENKSYSTDTIENYLGYYNLHIKGDPLTALKMAEVEEDDVVEFSSRMSMKKIGEKKNSEGIITVPGHPMAGSRTFVGIIVFMRMAFKHYLRKNRLWHNPWQFLRAPKLNSKPYDALTEEEVISLFAPGVLQTTMEKAICAAMFLTGARRSELYALKENCLSWKTQKIRIETSWQQFNKKCRKLGPTKSKRDREVPFDPIVQEAIKNLWEENGKHEFVFSWKKGKPPGSSWLNRHFPLWLERAKIDTRGRDITPHSARHSLASILMARGTPVKDIQELLGHSDPRTTWRYIHATAESIRSIGEKISETMGRPLVKEFEQKNIIQFRVS